MVKPVEITILTRSIAFSFRELGRGEVLGKLRNSEVKSMWVVVVVGGIRLLS